MKTETIEEFLARGGKVKKTRNWDEKFSTHTTHFHYGERTTGLSMMHKIENAFRGKRTARKKIPLTGENPFVGKRGFAGKHLRASSIPPKKAG